MIQGPTGWIVALSVAYVALGALTLWALLAARAPALVKGLLIIAVSGFYVAAFFGLRALPGYASQERLPPRFKLISGRVVEPHTISGDPGAIYIWIEEMDESGVLSGVPRAFRLPYGPKEGEDVENAVKRSDEGHPQEGRSGHGKEAEDWLGPNAGLTLESGAAAKGHEPGGERDDGVEFTPLGAPRLPAKDDQFAP
jgi:hypothetical protein